MQSDRKAHAVRLNSNKEAKPQRSSTYKAGKNASKRSLGWRRHRHSWWLRFIKPVATWRFYTQLQDKTKVFIIAHLCVQKAHLILNKEKDACSISNSNTVMLLLQIEYLCFKL